MRQGSEVYQQLKSLAKKKYGQSAGNVGDEGGVAPDIQTADEALDLIVEAISKAGYEGKVKIAMVHITIIVLGLSSCDLSRKAHFGNSKQTTLIRGCAVGLCELRILQRRRKEIRLRFQKCRIR